MTNQGGLGAVVGAGGTTFRVWAPRPEDVHLVLRNGDSERNVPMVPAAGGYREATVADASVGTRYGYVVDGQGPFPDPCSRSQPDGVHGLSEVVDPTRFAWTDSRWEAPEFAELVIYECHIGTFTPGGTFDSAISELPALRGLGVNAIELMPVAAFPGRWNWGYDGVALFAPAAPYGGPDGLRRLVDAAHRTGLAVILDVVCNHFGPNGNYTGVFSSEYLSERHHTPWGAAINFDGPGSNEVRRFYRENLQHWRDEYHIDGFRFDATHAIFDDSPEHILAELGRALRGDGSDEETPYLIAESHENDVRYVQSRGQGGFGFDAVWADDFHHCVRTLLLKEDEGYLRSYQGSVEELAETIEHGFFFEGRLDPVFGGVRGTRARECAWSSFVYCIQNHDQVGNHPFGERLNVTAAHSQFRAATLLLLLLPQIPMVFQGQEWLSVTPFLYFSDHDEELGRLVTEGRRREFAGFRAFSDPEIRELIPDAQAETTFRWSVLNHDEAKVGAGLLALELHRATLEVRHLDPVLHAYRRERLPITAHAEGDCLVVLFEHDGVRRWLVANFGRGTSVDLAGATRVILGSGEPRFGGRGANAELHEGTLSVPAQTAVFVAS